MQKDLARHDIEIQRNLEQWNRKPVLQKAYKDFYRLIRKFITFSVEGSVVELGSGIGNTKAVVPEAICTDLFPNPWIDRVENAYDLSFEDHSVSNLILFDVFHHLEHPGKALSEFYRVLAGHGRVIIFYPALSLVSLLVYGIFHDEPLLLFRRIKWDSPADFNPWKSGYYAAQSNAEKVFYRNHHSMELSDWEVVARKKYSCLAYLFSGGYSKPQLFPAGAYKLVKAFEKTLDLVPFIFASRMIVVLEKKGPSKQPVNPMNLTIEQH